MEDYIRAVMHTAEWHCERNGISESSFWDWLGNIKFKEDEGNLTKNRAGQIQGECSALIDEYLKFVEA